MILNPPRQYSKTYKPISHRMRGTWLRRRGFLVTLMSVAVFVVFFVISHVDGEASDQIDTVLHRVRENSNELKLREEIKETPKTTPSPDVPRESTENTNFTNAIHSEIPEIEPKETNEERLAMIRDEFTHAWSGYKKYAWKKDELHPVSKTGTNSLHMMFTLVDALDTLHIMGMTEEFAQARNAVAELEFNTQSEINTFECTIRVMGGLLSSYALTGDDVFKEKAQQLADKLLVAFDTPSGIPMSTVDFSPNIAYNPSWLAASISTSEAGTIQLEWSYLSEITGNSVYREKVDRALESLNKIRLERGLFTRFLNPTTSRLSDHVITVGARVDSIYEYFLKYWLFSGKTNQISKEMYDKTIEALIKELVVESTPSKLSYIQELHSGTPSGKMDHLVCFVPGMLALEAFTTESDAHMELAAGLMETCYEMYRRTPTGIAPEIVQFRAGQDFMIDAQSGHNILRPETLESLFVMWRVTHDQKYREWGWEIFQSFKKYCRVPSGGYAGLRSVLDVTTAEGKKNNWSDKMDSFFLAETLKYAFLLFSEDSVISLDEYVFNTEAHPLPIQRAVEVQKDTRDEIKVE